MSVQKILEYQKVDMALYKMERDFYQSKEVKASVQYKSDAQSKNSALNALASELDNCYTQLSAMSAKYDEAEKLRDELSEIDISTFEDSKDFEKYEKNLAKLEETLSSINKDTMKIVKRISEIGAESKNLNDLIDRYIKAYNIANAAMQKAKEEIRIKGAPYIKKLKELEPGIDPKYLTKYKTLRAKKLMPVFVPYQDGNCLGCGVEIKVEVDKLLNNPFDCAECPHCGRIVYILK